MAAIDNRVGPLLARREPQPRHYVARWLVDLVSVLVHDGDEPTSPVPARHDHPMFEVAWQCDRVLASGSIAGQVRSWLDASRAGAARFCGARVGKQNLIGEGVALASGGTG
jgi:hypothetical protein